MYLVTAATDFEMQAYVDAGGDAVRTLQLVSGLGPVETTLSLTCFLLEQAGRVDAVLNFGIGGAYPDNGTDLQAKMLDICLAESEKMGDLGICLRDRIERFDPAALGHENGFVLNRTLLARAGAALEQAGLEYKQGVFVTVNCASGTRKRGQLLGREFGALCENMEGAAVAGVCKRFSLPCLEVRCISNLVEDRDKDRWKLRQACREGGRAAAVIVDYLLEQDAG